MSSDQNSSYIDTAISDKPRSIVRFAAACGLAVGTLLIIVGSRGRVTKFLSDYEASLSIISSLALGFILPAAVILLLAVTVGVELGVGNPAIRNRWNLIAICLGLTALAIYVLGAGLPILKLLDALS